MSKKLFTMNWEEEDYRIAKEKARKNFMPLSSLIKNKILNEDELKKDMKKLMKELKKK